MFENFNLKTAAGAGEHHCEALLHEISTGAKNVLDYANHHRPPGYYHRQESGW